MTVQTQSISLNTRGNADIQDIASEVSASVAKSGLKNGIVTVSCPSSTSALTTVEFESGCLGDLLILYDWMRDPQTPAETRDLLEVFDDRFGRASTLVASQVPWRIGSPDSQIPPWWIRSSTESFTTPPDQIDG